MAVTGLKKSCSVTIIHVYTEISHLMLSNIYVPATERKIEGLVDYCFSFNLLIDPSYRNVHLNKSLRDKKNSSF